MSKKIIVGFNGAPQSWKSTTARDAMALLDMAGIHNYAISFVGFWDIALPAMMEPLCRWLENDPGMMSYEEAKQASVLGVTGRQIQIAATEAIKELIPDLPGKYAAAQVAAMAALGDENEVYFLENVGFPNEYRLLENTGLEIIRVYMTDKRAVNGGTPTYEFGDTFRSDSRKCLLTPDSMIDPTPQDLTRYITDRLEA